MLAGLTDFTLLYSEPYVRPHTKPVEIIVTKRGSFSPPGWFSSDIFIPFSYIESHSYSLE